MQAIIADNGQVRFVANHAKPEQTAGSALIRIEQAALTTLEHAIANGRLSHAGVLGCEFVGRIEAIESDDQRNAVNIGDRVVSRGTVYCGSCEMCAAGLRDHCRNRQIIGLNGCDGGLAQFITLPIKAIVAVPDGVDDDHAVFAQTVASAVQIVRQITIEGRPFITVLGDGPLALCAAQLLGELNATVRLVGRNQTHLERCAKWGIKHRHMDDIGRRNDQDIVINTTDRADDLMLSLQLVRPRGKVIAKSLGLDFSSARPDLPSSFHDAIILHEITLIGSAFGPVSEAVRLLEQHKVDIASLIERRVKLEDAALLLSSHPGLRVIVDV